MQLPAIDYVVMYWPFAAVMEPDRFGALENGSSCWLYVGKGSGPSLLTAVPTSPVWDAALVRFSPAGDRIVFADFCGSPRVWIWVQDAITGARRPVTSLPQMATAGDVSISDDGVWALIGFAPIYLVNLDTGVVGQLPDDVRAACWHPAYGPSTVLAARGDVFGPSEVGVLDLWNDSWNTMAKVETAVRGLDVSATGEIAMVANSAGQESWKPHVALLDATTGQHRPVVSNRLASGAVRETMRPRWTGRSPALGHHVRLSPALTSSLRPASTMPTPEDVARYYDEWFTRLQRRLRVLEERPADVVLLAQIVALTESCVHLNRAFVQAVDEVLIPALRTWSTHVQGQPRRAYEWAIAELTSICRQAA